LVKARSGLTANRLAVGDARIGFSVEPLFRSIGAGSQGVAPAATWQLLTPDADTDIIPWDACHVLLQQGLGVTGGGGVEFAEPDLAQRWRTGDERDLGLKLAKSCGKPDQQNKEYPLGPSPYWIRDAAIRSSTMPSSRQALLRRRPAFASLISTPATPITRRFPSFSIRSCKRTSSTPTGRMMRPTCRPARPLTRIRRAGCGSKRSARRCSSRPPPTPKKNTGSAGAS
jgi:hypothetical protein